MDAFFFVLLGLLSLGAMGVIAVRARRREPGQRLVVFLSGVFLLMLGLWTIAGVFPLIPLVDRIDALLAALLQAKDPAGLVAASAFLALVGLLVVRTIDYLSRARPEN